MKTDLSNFLFNDKCHATLKYQQGRCEIIGSAKDDSSYIDF